MQKMLFYFCTAGILSTAWCFYPGKDVAYFEKKLQKTVLISCTQSNQTKKYKNADGRFAIHFGADPQVSQQNVPTDAGNIEVHMFMYEKSATEVYLVGYSDYPSDMVAKADNQEMINGAKMGVVNNLKAKITVEKKILVSGNNGVWFKANSSQYFVTYKLFMVKNRLYQVGMIRDGSHVTDQSVKDFMDTFELLK